MSRTYFDDPKFQTALVSLLVKDRAALKACAGLISADDFKTKGKALDSSTARWIVATIALEHYEKYHEPVRDLLSSELKHYCHHSRLAAGRTSAIIHYGKKYLKRRVKSPQAIIDRVTQFKREAKKAAAVEEILDLQAAGKLTDDKWIEICRSAVEAVNGNGYNISDYFKDYKARIDRREFFHQDRFPLLCIPEFDDRVRAIARGHVGLVIAPYKRGKSLFLIHIARSYVLQRLNVLYITLEDPAKDVEDRFDASITHLPIKHLGEHSGKFKRRFKQFTSLMRTRLKIIDGTEQSVSIPKIETWLEEERRKGFIVDALIIDYDDELVATKKQFERRMEFADIYRDLRKLTSTRNLLSWTAAQTQRGTEMMKVLTGDRLAEDVSKVRKVSCALSLGQGDWGPDSIYLSVAAHKFDRQHIGVNIMTDKSRMLFYDYEGTQKAKKSPEKYVTEQEL